MKEDIIFVVEFSLKTGQLDRLKSLVNDIVEDIRPDEPDTVVYEYFISEDEQTCQIIERYVNSEAALKHLGNFGGKFGERLAGISEPRDFKICGNLSDDLLKMAAAAGATVMAPVGGFSR